MSKRNVLLALAALLIAAGSAYGQSLRFNVPFQFTTDTMAMPAGSYWIVASSPDSGLLTIQGTNRQTAGRRFLNSSPIASFDRQYQPKLVFNCYGDSCFLSQVWTGNSAGRQLKETHQEHQLAKQVSAPRVRALAALGAPARQP